MGCPVLACINNIKYKHVPSILNNNSISYFLIKKINVIMSTGFVKVKFEFHTYRE